MSASTAKQWRRLEKDIYLSIFLAYLVLSSFMMFQESFFYHVLPVYTSFFCRYFTVSLLAINPVVLISSLNILIFPLLLEKGCFLWL